MRVCPREEQRGHTTSRRRRLSLCREKLRKSPDNTEKKKWGVRRVNIRKFGQTRTHNANSSETRALLLPRCSRSAEIGPPVDSGKALAVLDANQGNNVPGVADCVLLLCRWEYLVGRWIPLQMARSGNVLGIRRCGAWSRLNSARAQTAFYFFFLLFHGCPPPFYDCGPRLCFSSPDRFSRPLSHVGREPEACLPSTYNSRSRLLGMVREKKYENM